MENKYDRQIRLFGFKTQEKISQLTVQILGEINYVSTEILKNLVLLGFQKIIVKPELINFSYKIIPDSISEVNENVLIETAENAVKCDFTFNVSKIPIKGCNICPHCYKITNKEEINSDEDHSCEIAEFGSDLLKIAHECFVGALSVQEFLKKIQGLEYNTPLDL